jgi:hypothetical protein
MKGRGFTGFGKTLKNCYKRQGTTSVVPNIHEVLETL